MKKKPQKNKQKSLASDKIQSQSPIQPLERSKVKSLEFIIIAIIIGVVIFVAFSPCLQNEFVNIDDNVYLYENLLIQDFSLKGIVNLLTTPYASNYHPLTGLTNMIEFHFFKLNPFPYHLNNIILHWIVSLLVWILLRLFIPNSFACLVGALFFAITPFKVESVAWISERKDLLYSLFFIIGLIFYTRQNSSKWTIKNYLLLTISFLLALLSKSAAVIFPCILLLIDYVKGVPILQLRYHLPKLPLFAISFIFGLIALKTQQNAVSDWDYTFTILDRFILTLNALWFYFSGLIIPLKLAHLHFYPIKETSLLPLSIYVGALISISIIFVSIHFRNKSRWILFLVGFFIVNLLLVLQIYSVGQAMVAERYSYMPSISLAFLLSLSFNYLCKKFSQNLGTAILVIAILGISTIYGSLTFNRCKVWKNPETLSRDLISKYPTHPFSYYFRGEALLKNGNAQDAENHFSKYLLYAPENPDALLFRAVCRDMNSNTSGALDDCMNAIKIRYFFPEAHTTLGIIKEKVNNFAGAESSYTIAIEQNPLFVKTYLNRGVLRGKQSKNFEAFDDFSKVISLQPTNSDAYGYRGIVQAMQKNYKASINDFSRALELNPSSNLVLFNRALAKFAIKDTAGGCNDLQKSTSFGNLEASRVMQTTCGKIN